MKRVALIHTVRPVLHTFENLLEEVVGQPLKKHNMLDEFLASDPAEVGSFTVENHNRLFNDLKSAELTGADLIIVTCSTLTPTVQKIRPFIATPILAIDDAMTEQAVKLGKRILVMATAASTLQPTVDKLQQDAALIAKKIEIEAKDNKPAYDAMRSGDLETHDRLVLEMAREVVGFDCIVLAQASMGHLQEQVETLTKIPTLASPILCCQKAKKILEGIDG